LISAMSAPMSSPSMRRDPRPPLSLSYNHAPAIPSATLLASADQFSSDLQDEVGDLRGACCLSELARLIPEREALSEDDGFRGLVEELAGEVPVSRFN